MATEVPGTGVTVRALPLSTPPMQYAVERKETRAVLGTIEGASIPDRGYHRNHAWIVRDANGIILGDRGTVVAAVRLLVDKSCTCGQPHERLATPEEVDAGAELGIGYDPCPGGEG